MRGLTTSYILNVSQKVYPWQHIAGYFYGGGGEGAEYTMAEKSNFYNQQSIVGTRGYIMVCRTKSQIMPAAIFFFYLLGGLCGQKLRRLISAALNRTGPV